MMGDDVELCACRDRSKLWVIRTNSSKGRGTARVTGIAVLRAGRSLSGMTALRAVHLSEDMELRDRYVE